MQKNIVVITGCSSGVGSAAAIAFAKADYQVIATMRNLDKSMELQTMAKRDNLKIDLRQLDVTNEFSILNGIRSILNDYQKIDVLVNNAGAGFLGSLEQTSLSDAKNVMDVNFFGVWRITQAVLPSMRKQKSGKIISVTSVGGIVGQPFNDAYCAAKFAVEGLMESLAPVARRLGIQVSLIEPGPINTAFVASVRKNSPAMNENLIEDYKPLLEAYSKNISTVFAEYAQTPDDIAKIILSVAQENKAKFRYQTSQMSQELANQKFVDSSGEKAIALSEMRLSS